MAHIFRWHGFNAKIAAVALSSLYKLSSFKGVNGVIKDIRLISSGSEINKSTQGRIPDSTSLSTRLLIELASELRLIESYWLQFAKLAQVSEIGCSALWEN